MTFPVHTPMERRDYSMGRHSSSIFVALDAMGALRTSDLNTILDEELLALAPRESRDKQFLRIRLRRHRGKKTSVDDTCTSTKGSNTCAL